MHFCAILIMKQKKELRRRIESGEEKGNTYPTPSPLQILWEHLKNQFIYFNLNTL